MRRPEVGDFDVPLQCGRPSPWRRRLALSLLPRRSAASRYSRAFATTMSAVAGRAVRVRDPVWTSTVAARGTVTSTMSGANLVRSCHHAAASPLAARIGPWPHTAARIACSVGEWPIVHEVHPARALSPSTRSQSSIDRVLLRPAVRACARVSTPSCSSQVIRRARMFRRAECQAGSLTLRLRCATGAHRRDNRAEIAGCGAAARRLPSAIPGSPARGWRSRSSRRHAPTGSMLTRRELGQRPVRERAQRQQLLAGGRRGQGERRPLAPEEPHPQKQPWHRDRQDRRRSDRQRQHATPATSPSCRGCAPRPAMSSAASLAARNGLLSASPISGTPSSAVARGVQIARDAVGAVVYLPAHLGDRRDRGVDRQPDEYPDGRPRRRRRRR